MATELNRSEIERIVRSVLEQQLGQSPKSKSAPAPARNPLLVNISARHVHLSQEHVEILYGPGAARADEDALPGRLFRGEADRDGGRTP